MPFGGERMPLAGERMPSSRGGARNRRSTTPLVGLAGAVRWCVLRLGRGRVGTRRTDTRRLGGFGAARRALLLVRLLAAHFELALAEHDLQLAALRCELDLERL